MNKLRAIWKILTSEYYLLLTSGGSITACMPKDINKIVKMNKFIDEFQNKEGQNANL